LIAVLAAVVPSLACLFFFRSWHRMRKEVDTCERFAISAADVGAPELIMRHAEAVKVRIGAKWLYIGSLNIDTADVYYLRLLDFIQKYKGVLNLFHIFETADMQDGPERDAMMVSASRFLQSRPVWKAVVDLLGKTILRDPACNPQGITEKYLSARVSVDQLLQLFCGVYWYNVGAGVKKKFMRLAEALASWEVRGLSSCTPWKLPDNPKSGSGLCHCYACGFSFPLGKSANHGDRVKLSNTPNESRTIASE
jgi:hypothetical protein